MSLSPQEITRYARHIRLNNVGIEGQERLKMAKVLVIGAGGLGCPVLQYLVAAGVGTIGIVDDDLVDETNLQRQVLYDLDDVGLPKAESAVRKLTKQNPFVAFNIHAERLTTENALKICAPYDILIDGTDNFPTRYLVGDVSVILGKPLVFGSIFKFEGQVSVFNYEGGPSYRCLYPEPPTAGQVPNCSEVGVIGVLPGVIGTRMATECLKIILGIGEVLSGQLLLTDLLGNTDRVLRIRRNDENFTRKVLEEDYLDFCGLKEEQREEGISPETLHEWLVAGKSVQLVDVREPFEFEICRIEGSISIPLGELNDRLQDLDTGLPKVMICHHGTRSAAAIDFLRSKGMGQLINLEGGIHAWAKVVEPQMPTY